MSHVIAKFHVAELAITSLNGGVLKARAVMRGDRNASFAKASPSGDLEAHLTEDELRYVLDLRDRARAGHELRRARAAEVKALTGVIVPLPHAGTELFLDLKTEAMDAPIVRTLHLAVVPDGDTGRVEFTAGDDGPWAKLSIYVDNLSAVRTFQSAKHHGQTDWVLGITASTDGFAEDGHPFRTSIYPAGVYGHDLCGECFGRLDEHHPVA